jgi:hypothetical protein
MRMTLQRWGQSVSSDSIRSSVALLTSCGPDSNCALPHALNARDADMFELVKDECVVHLICQNEDVVLDGKCCKALQLLEREHFADRVCPEDQESVASLNCMSTTTHCSAC